MMSDEESSGAVLVDGRGTADVPRIINEYNKLRM